MPSFRHVVVIGAGLMGTSLGLALRRCDVDVQLLDLDPTNLRLAVSLGAGRPVASPQDRQPVDVQGFPSGTQGAGDRPHVDLVVVSVPPDTVTEVSAEALRRYPEAVVTDLASVKAPPAKQLADRLPSDASRYVGGHPMAGSERSGPLAASADLFDGRAWAVTPHPASGRDAVAVVEELAQVCGAYPIRLAPDQHDDAVALVSHLPHVASSVVAGLLTEAPEQHLELAGQGLRDVTRVAAGDPALWTQILSANARPVSKLLQQAATRLIELAGRLEKAEPVDELLGAGVQGVGRLPGKHGVRAEDFVAVTVLLPDRPGELARLFGDVGAAGVNIEDVRIDHSPGTSAGLVELLVIPHAEHSLSLALRERGWALPG